jgi:hypothetical protein
LVKRQDTLDRCKIFRGEIVLATIYGGEKAKMRKEEEETEIIMGEKYPKLEKGKKIEATRKYTPKEDREAANGLLSDGPYSDIDEVCRITQAQYKTGGLVRQPVLDGGGRSTFEWVFAGNARPQQDGRAWSDTCDPVAKPDWSLGSNTLEIEAKLRVHKQQERYTEVTPKAQRRGGKRRGAGRKPK